MNDTNNPTTTKYLPIDTLVLTSLTSIVFIEALGNCCCWGWIGLVVALVVFGLVIFILLVALLLLLYLCSWGVMVHSSSILIFYLYCILIVSLSFSRSSYISLLIYILDIILPLLLNSPPLNNQPIFSNTLQICSSSTNNCINLNTSTKSTLSTPSPLFSYGIINN